MCFGTRFVYFLKTIIMKNLLVKLSVLCLILSACEGEPGPPGFDGRDGLDGAIIASSAFEIIVDLNASNNFEYIEPYGFEVYPSDVTLVYILWETTGGQDVWRLMPQTALLDEGLLIYNFDFTQDDVRFFLDGNIDFITLDTIWTDNQIFRVVVVPADNIDGLDISNINNVINKFDIHSITKRN